MARLCGIQEDRHWSRRLEAVVDWCEDDADLPARVCALRIARGWFLCLLCEAWTDRTLDAVCSDWEFSAAMMEWRRRGIGPMPWRVMDMCEVGEELGWLGDYVPWHGDGPQPVPAEEAEEPVLTPLTTCRTNRSRRRGSTLSCMFCGGVLFGGRPFAPRCTACGKPLEGLPDG